MYLMEHLNESKPQSVFSHRRRTAAILIGDGTAVAYMAGVMKALKDAGIRIDIVLGKGAGALVAAFSAIDAEERLEGKNGLLARAVRKRPWRLCLLYKVTAVCLLLCITAFVSPLVMGAIFLLALPFIAVSRLIMNFPGEGQADLWLEYLFSHGEPVYLRAVVIPIFVLCVIWLAWWVISFIRDKKAPSLPELFDLGPLELLLESTIWKAVRGASTNERPRNRTALGVAYQELLSGSLGQHGFKELVFYSLDCDSGREASFALLKQRHFKKFSEHYQTHYGSRSAEPIDLSSYSGALFFDALLASLSPPGIVPSVSMRLPFGTPFGGEVHQFSSSLLAGRKMLPDAIAAGAEQVVFVVGCASSESLSGNTFERLVEVSLRNSIADELEETASLPELPIFIVRPDKQRLSVYEITGRSQGGNERLGLTALYAHGRRDAATLFVDANLGNTHQIPNAEPSGSAPLSEKSLGGPDEF